MAGSISFRLGVAHVFQRKFSSPELADALKGCYWYIISRRPKTRINPKVFDIKDDVLVSEFIIHGKSGKDGRHLLGLDLKDYGPASDARLHANGSYFSFSLDGVVMHGDAWALASLMSSADLGISRQEIMYIGKAYGDGSSDAWIRTSSHKKLQLIHESHAGEEWDFFVSPLVLRKRSWSGDDHVDDDEEGPSWDGYYRDFADYGGGIKKDSVDIVEHALISYFKPYYNENLLNWNPKSPTQPMTKAMEHGFRLVHVHLDGWNGLSRFYTRERPNLHRSHFISRSMSGKPIQDVDHGDASRLAKRVLSQGPKMFSSLAEHSDIYLRAFGEKAPEIRRPPDFDPLELSEQKEVTFDHRSIEPEDEKTQIINRIRKDVIDQRSMVENPDSNSIPIEPTYSEKTGEISLSADSSGGAGIRWKIHGDRTEGVNSGIILGGDGSGKSNALFLVMFEAIRSGKFIIFPASCRGSLKDRAMLEALAGAEERVEIGTEESYVHLVRAVKIIDTRNELGGYSIPCREKPGILFCIDDVDELLEKNSALGIIEYILDNGPGAGVGLVLVLRDIKSVYSSFGLMSRFVKMKNFLRLAPYFDPYFWKEIEVRGSEKRKITYCSESAPTVILESRSDYRTVGFLVSTSGAHLSADQAQEWATRFLERNNIPLIGWQKSGPVWFNVGGLNFSMWELRKHPDAWALVNTLARHGKRGEDDSLHSLIEWGEDILESRFKLSLTCWSEGPGSQGEGVMSIYANVLAGIRPKDQSWKLDAIIQHLY
jgi:hypothetical protein